MQRHELVVHNILLVDVEVVQQFHACGWLGYYLYLTELNEEVAMELMRTFDEGEATVWGLTIILLKSR